ncbi:MAG: hypothetical protein AAGA29_06465 [Planctomycetota bacterium]
MSRPLANHSRSLLASCCLAAASFLLTPAATAQPSTAPAPEDPLALAQQLREQALADLETARALEEEHRATFNTPATPEAIRSTLDDLLAQGTDTPEDRIKREELQTRLNRMLNQGRQPVRDGQLFSEWRNLLILDQGYFSLDFRIIEPKLRVYFDTGTDDNNEVDIFRDGNLAVTVNALEIRFTHHFYDERKSGFDINADGKLIDRSPWSWGFNIGAGVGVPAQESPDGTKSSSNAPVVLLTFGVFLEYDIFNLDANERKQINEIIPSSGFFSEIAGASPGAKIGIEFGYALGFSADENFDDIIDGALYFGLTFHVPF